MDEKRAEETTAPIQTVKRYILMVAMKVFIRSKIQ